MKHRLMQNTNYPVGRQPRREDSQPHNQHE